MRSPVSASRSRFVYQASLVVLLAGASASCSNSLRLQEPFFTGSTDNQRQILSQNNYAGAGNGDASAYQSMPAPVVNNTVTRSDLPPPPVNNYASADPVPAYAPDTESAQSGASLGWSAVGGRVVTVGSNDNLDRLTAKYGVPQEQILTANQLNSAAQVRPGKILVIPRRVAMAPGAAPAPLVAYNPPAPKPISAPAVKPTILASGGSTYIVQPGETLFGVARKNGTTVAALATLNGLSPTSALETGEKLRVSGAPAKVAAVATPAPVKVATQLGTPPHPLGTLTMKAGENGQSDQAAPAAAPKIRLASPADTAETGNQIADNAPQAPAMPSIPVAPHASDVASATNASANAIDDAADAASTDGKQFRWPVRGRIISGFGTKPNGEKNDGINLAVPEGTSVKSIEAGTVIYAGNELEGYGNLVLIRHAGGWVSAYAHNEDLQVKRGDTVRRGQIVAHAGMTGSVTSPQVHFELRMGAKPVNPLDYLAGA
jgi:murein DD-endopeptidase MepM/ murein hydrolase activator NlpD